MMPDNNWYGHRKILSNYCNKNDFHVFAIIQHGWFLNSPTLLFTNKRLQYINFLSWSTNFTKLARKEGFKIIPIGSPFLYLCKLKNFNFEKDKKKGEGTILFPGHSTKDEPQLVDHKNFIKTVKDNYPPPYSVSIFYKDLNINIAKIYKDEKFNIVCFGSRGNQYFLYELYNEVLKHRNVISTEPGTSIIYSMYLGKKCHILYKDNNNLNLNKFEDLRTKEFFQFKAKNEFKKILHGTMNLDEQFYLAKKELGYENLLLKSELIQRLGWDDKLKKISAFFVSKYIDLKHGKTLRSGKDV